MTFKNNCEIHLRCEGIAIVDETEELPEEYICVQCTTEKPNSDWLEKVLRSKNEEFTKTQRSLSVQIASVKAEIAHLEHIEESESGPRQRKLNNSLKQLGDVARFHGGALPGKQVQKVLDNSRDGTFELLDCIKDKPDLFLKYSGALTCLANISDSPKTSGPDFDEEGVEMVKYFCEEWGKIWPVLFPQRNITPKGHIMAFVLPRIVENTEPFSSFIR